MKTPEQWLEIAHARGKETQPAGKLRLIRDIQDDARAELIAAIRARELQPDQTIIAHSKLLSDNSAGLDECVTGDLKAERANHGNATPVAVDNHCNACK